MKGVFRELLLVLSLTACGLLLLLLLLLRQNLGHDKVMGTVYRDSILRGPSFYIDAQQCQDVIYNYSVFK